MRVQARSADAARAVHAPLRVKEAFVLDGTDCVVADWRVPDATTAWPHGAPKAGQRAERSRVVGPNDIELFTAISGDRNPLHYDAERAARTRFGGIVVQGGITSAILNAVVAEDLPGPGTVFLHVNWDFKAPVRPGDTIVGQVEITKVRDDKPITELLTRVVRGDGTLVLDGTAVCYTVTMDAEEPKP